MVLIATVKRLDSMIILSISRDVPGIALVITFFTTLFTLLEKSNFFVGAAVSQILMYPLKNKSIQEYYLIMWLTT